MLSQAFAITNWVVQDGVIGSALFPLYTDGIFTVIRHGTPFVFAVEIKIAYPFEFGSFNSPLALINEDPKFLDN